MGKIVKIVCACVVVLCCAQLLRINRAQKLAQSSYQELRASYRAEEAAAAPSPAPIQIAPPEESTAQPEPETPGETEPEAAESTVEPTEPEPDTDRFAELLARNGDFVGWLSVEDTRIDYPVVRSPLEPEYYLKRDFDGNSNGHGVPFMDTACDLWESENLIIYGHNMRDGTMFFDLAKFTKPEFCEQHPLITFDTLAGCTTWQVVSVFKIAAKDTRIFPYHRVTEFSPDTQTAKDYLARCAYYAIWTDDTPVAEDTELLTLSTCEYTLRNGRLVVVAKRIG